MTPTNLARSSASLDQLAFGDGGDGPVGLAVRVADGLSGLSTSMRTSGMRVDAGR
jgi:hypothetical protein